MKSNALFAEVASMTEAEAQAFMESHPSESYQLVDVRQPGEYEESHLPAAVLVPLNVLTAGGGKLNPDKPTIVYCRSGGRSAAATQFLVGQGFKHVFDIGKNIVSWLGLRVDGPPDAYLDLIRPEAEFPDAWSLAFAMEEGLQRYYVALEKAETREAYRRLYRKLAGFEDLHKERLNQAYRSFDKSRPDLDRFMKEHPQLIEAGAINQHSPLNIIGQLKTPVDVFSLSMAIEARSQDLYFRLAQQSTDSETRRLFLELADEEKMHLAYLGEEMNLLFKKAAATPA